MIPANRQRNYLQSALYVIIASVLAVILLERLLTYAEIAEKASMEATISAMHAALYARAAHLALRGQRKSLEALPRQNPFALTEIRATNYLGEFDDLPVDAERGSWLYHRGKHELLYLPRLSRYVVVPDDASPVAFRFRIDLQRSTNGEVSGVRLEASGAARWEPGL